MGCLGAVLRLGNLHFVETKGGEEVELADR